MGNLIKYKKGFKYQLAEQCITIIGIFPKEDIETRFIVLRKNGFLLIETGYAWDGPSGPTIDTSNFMKASLIHDALYQLIRQGHLSFSYRGIADKELHRICLEDGMCKFRANYIYKAVCKHGGPSASPNNIKKVYTAPKYSRKINSKLS